MRKLLIATTNVGKVREISALLEGLQSEIIGLSDLAEIPPVVEETGKTFTANAIIKSEYYFAQTGLLSLADDSGLEVDALHGAPGVSSARFAGADATDAERVVKILAELYEVPKERRTARFVCSLALTGEFKQGIATRVFTGIADGLITLGPRGSGGFGYDPIFEEQELQRTFAELTQAEKSARSHRGKALTAAKEFLFSAFFSG